MAATASPEQLARFADALGVSTSVELAADGRPALDAADGEEVAAAFGGVDAAIGDDGLSLGSGTVRIVWVPAGGGGAAGGALALRYPQIVMHAVATDAGSFGRPCLYLQLDEGSDCGADGEPTGLGAGAAAAAGASGSEEGGEEEEGALGAELRLVPGSGEEVEALFKAMCDCSALNPDSGSEDDGQAELFFDEAEVLAGLPAEQRDALMAARAAGGLALRDELDELMQGDPERFGDDDEEEGEEGEGAGAAAGAAGAGANGTAA